RSSRSKFEVSSNGSARSSLRPGGGKHACRQQPRDAAEVLPCGFGESRIGANKIADHLPCGQVQSSLWRRSHGQRNRTLRTEVDPLRRRLLPGPNPHRLREHIDRNGLTTRLKLTAAAQTVRVFQESPPAPWIRPLTILSRPSEVRQVRRVIPLRF